jgi:type II secretory pathway pseudopilin PulG
MKICAKQFLHRAGFTMVEVFVAVAIIAALISLIIPALTMVRKSAAMARQRAQFHSIEIALEAFRADFGDYPESIENSLTEGLFKAYPGAMKLAEAIIGQDGFGFHPRSEFRNDGLADWNGDGTYDDPDESVYHVGQITPHEGDDENLTARKGPYLELETANAVKLNHLYYENGAVLFPEDTVDKFVLADMFRNVKHLSTSKDTGMPILYYRANTSRFKHDPADYSTQPDDNIYDYRDNQFIVGLGLPSDSTFVHPMSGTGGDSSIFYKNTLNPNFTDPKRPYRADSFILLSAGPDGQYGTPDDVFNFNKAE